MDRSGRVILVGPLSPWEEPKREGDQIWCLNKGYEHQPNLDRIYMMDPIVLYAKVWGWGFIDEINALGVPVVLREPYPTLVNSVQFNFKESFDTFSISFFGATAANAISNAIEEGFADLVLHRMYIKGESDDYQHHKAAVAFWVGQAIRAGIRIHVDPNCFMEQDVLDKVQNEVECREKEIAAGIDIEPYPPPPLQDMLIDDKRRIKARLRSGAAV